MHDREILLRLDHQHRLLHSILEGQAEILDALGDLIAAEKDNDKLRALRAKITAKTEALKAALAAAPK